MRLGAALPLLAVLAAVACSSSSATSTGAQDAAPAWAPDGADTDTWASWSLGFFTRYCVECHAANDPKGLDFGVHSTVTASKDLIRCGVSVQQQASWGCAPSPVAKQFPISDQAGTNPKPSDAERDRVVAWIGAGCP